MFDPLDPLVQPSFVISRTDRHLGTEEWRSAVHLGRHPVNGRAGYRQVPFQRGPYRLRTSQGRYRADARHDRASAVIGQQRRVDVDHASGELIEKGRGEDQHPPGQHHEIGLEGGNGVGEAAIVSVPCDGIAPVLGCQRDGRDAGTLSTAKRPGY